MKKHTKKTGHQFEVPLENYLKAIWNLAQQKGSQDAVIRNSEIATYLHVTRPSVSDMLKKLLQKNYVKKAAKSTGVQLSKKGKNIVFTVLRRHRLIELFLEKTLKLTPAKAHEEAELLEHAVSKELVDKIDQHLNYPESDSNGMPIPNDKNHFFDDRQPHIKRLSDLSEGAQALIISITDYSAKDIENFSKLGICRGKTVRLVKRLKNNSFKVASENNQEFIILSETQSKLIFVN